MKLGVSTDPTRVNYVKDAGFDYLELAISPLAQKSEQEFKESAKIIEGAGLPVEAFNGFLAPGNVLIGEDADLSFVKNYVKKALSRAKSLGGEIIVFGNGGFRKIPDGYNREKALKQLDDAVKVMGEQVEKIGMTLVLEHLNFSETNTLNTFKEVCETVNRVNLKNVRALVDFYHLFMVEEPLENVEKGCKLIEHAHLARPNQDRKIPNMDDLEPMRAWSDCLKKCGYDKRISIEASPRDKDNFAEEIKQARKVMEIFK